MNIKPIAGAGAVQHSAPLAPAYKAKAVAAFNQNAAQSQPQPQIVQNQTSIAPEEMGAIHPERQSDEIVEQIQQDEQQVETQEPAKTEDPAISRQFAQLARQERALRAKAQQQEQAYKAREAALAAREQELAAKPSFDPKQYYTKDQVKQNALDILAESGVSYEELTQQILTQQPVDPRLQQTISQLKQQIEDLKTANEDNKKSYADQQTQAYQAAVKQIETDARQLIKADPVAYEAIHKTGTVKEVVKLITDTYHKDGILMSIEEAAQKIEDYLVEENYKMANQINKIKQRMQSVAPKAPTAQTPAVNQKQQQPMKTLTNATSSTRQLGAKERAILAFKGQLAKS